MRGVMEVISLRRSGSTRVFEAWSKPCFLSIDKFRYLVLTCSFDEGFQPRLSVEHPEKGGPHASGRREWAPLRGDRPIGTSPSIFLGRIIDRVAGKVVDQRPGTHLYGKLPLYVSYHRGNRPDALLARFLITSNGIDKWPCGGLRKVKVTPNIYP